MILIVKNIYYCPKCNRELKEKDMCAVVGHVSKSCRYCHTDVKRIGRDIKESIL